MVCMALGGRVAEEVCLGKITTGARDDLDRVTKMMYGQITKYGMGKFGSLAYHNARGEGGFSPAPYSDLTAQEIDEEVRNEVNRLYLRTKELISSKKDDIEKLAKKLLEKQLMSRQDVQEILGPRPFEIRDRALDMYDGKFEPNVDVSEERIVTEDAKMTGEVKVMEKSKTMEESKITESKVTQVKAVEDKDAEDKGDNKRKKKGYWKKKK
jgi:AFG3 family protein